MASYAKISLIGSGQIGGTVALLIASHGLGNVVLLDRDEGTAKGKALDILQCGACFGSDYRVIGSSDYADIADSDVIVVTAGSPRKPGMSRDELLNVNADVISNVAEGVAKYAPNAFVIIVTNPLDVMVCLFQKKSCMSTSKVVGMAGVLDSARLRYFLACEFAVSVSSVDACVLGGHGDMMVPVISHSYIGNVSVFDMIKNGFSSAQNIDKIVQRTRDGGAEIINLLGAGSAFYAPAASIVEMVKAYLADRKKVLPVAAWLTGEYGVDGLYMGVPAVIGRGGVEKIVEIDLLPKERDMFAKSASAVKVLVNLLHS